VLYEKAGRLPGQMVGKSDHLHAVHVTDAGGEVGQLVRVRILSSSTNSLAGERLALAG
jgi:tRNA-2-methylthio-N6-dimethylallyladenosine synthase